MGKHEGYVGRGLAFLVAPCTWGEGGTVKSKDLLVLLL